MTDIIVVGAGGCGLMAALVAGREGARVLVLEKTDQPGGGTALSHRGLRAADSRYQRQLDVSDNPDRYAEEILGRNGNQSDVSVTKHLTEVSGRMVDFLAEVTDADFYLDEFSFGQGARRSHRWRTDAPITDLLYAALGRETDVEVCFSTPVTGLTLTSGGAVTGVVTPDRAFEGSKVILASGGFGASPELLARYIPKAVGVSFPGHHGSTGDGIEIGLGIGGVVDHMDAFQPYPAHVGPGKRGVPPDVIMSGGIMVDRHGRRFVDETRYPGGVAAAILDLPDKQAFEIFDERIYRMHQGFSGERSLPGMLDDGLLRRSGTPEELARMLGIDVAGLRETISDHNRSTANGADAFDRALSHRLEPPLYGIRVTVALYHTQGGLRVDAHGQVLRADGEAIPNLYAGGGVAAGVSGNGLDGYLPGNGLLASLGFGLIAAEHAVRSLRSVAGVTNAGRRRTQP